MSYIAQERDEIIKELLDTKKVRAGQSINYAQFLELYEPYKDIISQQEFAEMLGIRYGNYMHIKHKGTKARILKERKEKISEEKREEIIEELLSTKRVRVGQFIDYSQLLELYEPYTDIMSEQELAGILGIKYDNYKSIKNKRNKNKNIKRKKRKNKRRRKRTDNRKIT